METYQELIQRALGSGKIANIQAEVVRENDVFTYNPTESVGGVHHGIQPGGRGDMIGVYCVTTLSNGGQQYVWLDRQEIFEQHQALSKKEENWVKYPQSYWRKTAVREASKWWPYVEGLDEVIARDNKDFDLERVNKETGEVTAVERPARPTAKAASPAPKPKPKPEATGSPDEPPHPADDGLEAIRAAVGGTMVGAGSPDEPAKAEEDEGAVWILATSDGQQRETRTGKETTNFYGKLRGEGDEDSRFTIWEHLEVPKGVIVKASSVDEKDTYRGKLQYWVNDPVVGEWAGPEQGNGKAEPAGDIPF